MLEIETTYLAKYLPKGLENCESDEIIDVYLPKSAVHPQIRVRKCGNKLEITKKQPVDNEDKTHQHEHTINLNKDEYDALAKIDGKRLRKIRYYYDYNGRVAEIAVFQDELKGLVTVEFEFNSKKELDAFKMPDFCLADVRNEDFIAGGILCGKKYDDIKHELDRYGYKRLFLK